MKGIDITKLVEGLLALIFISVCAGTFGALQDFARREANMSLRGWPTHAFFPDEYRKLMRGAARSRGHSKQ